MRCSPRSERMLLPPREPLIELPGKKDVTPEISEKRKAAVKNIWADVRAKEISL